MYTHEDVTKLTNEDILDKWIVIKPEIMRKLFMPGWLDKQHQVVKARGGFGCVPSSLSIRGGKIFITDLNGNEDFHYRNEVLGLATPDILKELGIE